MLFMKWINETTEKDIKKEEADIKCSSYDFELYMLRCICKTSSVPSPLATENEIPKLIPLFELLIDNFPYSTTDKIVDAMRN